MFDGVQRGSLPRTAAEWFAAHLRPHDAQLDQRFSEWLAADPKNADEYALCGLTWELSGAVAREVDMEVTVHRARRVKFRRLIGYGAAAGVAVLSIALLLYQRMLPVVTQWSTGPGEQKTIALTDGSHVILNTRSSLEVRMSRSRRDIRLAAGEAFFEVAKDASRPFVVQMPLGEARAVGTRFNVLLDGDREEVTTEEGKVLVQTSRASGEGVLAAAGMKATLVRGEASAELGQADLGRIENWRAHRIELDRVPLEAALREVSRYTELPVRAPSLEVQHIPISAVLKTGDIQALKVMLKGAFDLDVVAGKSEWLVVTPHDGSALRSTPEARH